MLNNRTLVNEYNLLKANAERIVAVYFGVSGYKVSNISFYGDMMNVDYYDIGAPSTIKVPEVWLTLTDDELISAVKAFSLAKHNEYMAWQTALLAEQQTVIETRERTELARLKAKYEGQ